MSSGLDFRPAPPRTCITAARDLDCRPEAGPAAGIPAAGRYCSCGAGIMAGMANCKLGILEAAFGGARLCVLRACTSIRVCWGWPLDARQGVSPYGHEHSAQVSLAAAKLN